MRTIEALALGVAMLVAVASGCGGEELADPASVGTTSGTARASSFDTLATRPRSSITRPEVVRQVPSREIPDRMRFDPNVLLLTAEEGNCIDTVLVDYASDPGAPTDNEALVGVLGGAITACVDQARVAQVVVKRARAEDVTLTDDVAACITEQLVEADPGALAIFLGALFFNGAGVPEMQAPFAAAIVDACGI